MVKLLLKIGKANVNQKDKEGRTPLLWAVERGHEVVVKRLLDRQGRAKYLSLNFRYIVGGEQGS